MEMKGHLAVPANLLLEETRRALLPRTVYAKAHGGAPDAIPDLTHADLVAFHRRHYHPSNARILLWGDHDIEARLDQIDRHRLRTSGSCPARGGPVGLRGPAVRATDYRTACSGRPRAHRDRLGAAEGWGPLGSLGRKLMTLLLAELPGAPLPQALEASVRGRILAGTPRLEAFRQPVLTIGLEAIESSQVGQVEEVSLQALSRIVRQGFEAGYLERGLDALELRLRENVAGPRPRGLVVLGRILGAWRHGADPLDLLKNHGPALARLRERVVGEQAALRELIRTDLLDNPHRVTLSLEPGRAAAGTEADRLSALGRGLSLNARRRLVRRTAARSRGTGPSKAARRSLPVLSLAELPHEVIRVPTQASGRVLLMELGEPGILRADLAMDLEGVPPAWLGYVPILGRLMVQGGGDASAGLLAAEAWSRSGPRREAACLVLRGKSLGERGAELLGRMAARSRPPSRPSLASWRPSSGRRPRSRRRASCRRVIRW
jgi:hypothetical protein